MSWKEKLLERKRFFDTLGVFLREYNNPKPYYEEGVIIKIEIEGGTYFNPIEEFIRIFHIEYPELYPCHFLIDLLGNYSLEVVEIELKNGMQKIYYDNNFPCSRVEKLKQEIEEGLPIRFDVRDSSIVVHSGDKGIPVRYLSTSHERAMTGSDADYHKYDSLEITTDFELSSEEDMEPGPAPGSETSGKEPAGGREIGELSAIKSFASERENGLEG